MLKNPNQKVIKRMAGNALKVNRRKTITLFLAVLLSSFLVFTMFTVGDSYFRLQKIQNIRMSGAEFDAIMYGVTDEQRQMCENNPNIALTGTVGVCGWVEKTDQDSTPDVGLIWADDGYWTQMMEPVREKLEGRYPTALDEIMVTKSALKECGYEDLDVGDTLAMSYGTHEGIFTGTFRICGLWDGYGPKKQFYVSKEFYDQSGWKLSQAASGRYFMDFKQKIMTKEELALEVIARLKKEYPDAGCTLDYDQAWKLLVSVRLAAQCTDARVNVVVEELYAKYPDVASLAAAEPEEIEEIVRPCGLGRSKARDISACMRILHEQYDDNIPTTFEALLKLPGVGRKSANLIMGDVFGKPAIVTDTHCIRLCNRIGLVDGIKEPKKVEMALWKIIPPEEGSDFCHRLVYHGREVCTARTKPYCDRCCLEDICAKNI